MRFKKFLFFIPVLFVVFCLGMPELKAEAKGGGCSAGRSGGFSSGRSSGMSSSSRSSSGGYSSSSKAASPSPSSSVAKASSGGYSSGTKTASSDLATATSKSTSPVSKDAAARSKSDFVSTEQSKKAMADYKAQKAQFTEPSSPVKPSPTVQQTVINKTVIKSYHYNPEDYAYRSRTFYGNRGWTAPGYAYRHSSGFGMWNAVALWFMLDHIHDQQYSMMYYSHRNDPDMMEWRHQAEAEAKENAELKAKLDAMDQRMQGLEKDGVKEDPGYVPDEMKEVALDENVLAAIPETDPELHQFPLGWVLAAICAVLFGGYLLCVRKY